LSLETHRKGSTQPGNRKKRRRNVARGCTRRTCQTTALHRG